MEYDNNRPFSSEGAAQERKRKHALGKGVIIGVVATLLVVILALSCVFIGLIRSGNIHIGMDGRIYVQDVGTSDNEGIGTKVEGKLNALDSLLGDGFYFDDVDDESYEESHNAAVYILDSNLNELKKFEYKNVTHLYWGEMIKLENYLKWAIIQRKEIMRHM